MLKFEGRPITMELLSGKSDDGASGEFDKEFSLRRTVSLWSVLAALPQWHSLPR